jgi:hypothetical protein
MMVVCSKTNENCMNQTCSKCQSSQPLNHILDIYTDTNTNDDVEWMNWRKSESNGLQIQRIQSTVEVFLEELDHQWEKDLLHYYITSQQCKSACNHVVFPLHYPSRTFFWHAHEKHEHLEQECHALWTHLELKSWQALE